MPLVPILLPPGLERNGTPYDTVKNWWDMNLMRWVSGSARPIGGWVRKTSAPLDSAIRHFHAWQTNDASRRTLAGTDHKLLTDFSGGWLDITPTDLVPPTLSLVTGYGTGPYGMYSYGTPRPAGISSAFNVNYAHWSFDNWGEDVLLLSSLDNRLFHYVGSTPDVVPSPMPDPPLSNAVCVTDERHVMLAGPVISGTYYPHRICWASSESLTDWNFASLTNTAGFLDLQCTSPLNWLCKVREGILAFTSTEVFLVTYVGLPYIYGAQRIAEMPIFHPYSIVAYGAGRAMWFSPRAFQGYANGSVSPMDCPIFNDIKDDFAENWGPLRCHTSGNGLFPELWFFWPSANASDCDRYVIVNYLEGWWGWGFLGRSAMIASGALRRPLAGTIDGNIYEHENGWTDAGNPIMANRWLESGALGIQQGDNIVDVKQAMMSTQDRFHDVPQSVKLQFFGRYAPDGNERVFGPYLPRLDGYTDTRVNCREARIRMMGNIDGLFDVGLLRLDVSTGGRR